MALGLLGILRTVMEKVGYAEPAVVGVFCTVDGKYDTTVDAIASALMEIFDDFKIAPAIVLERLYCMNDER